MRRGGEMAIFVNIPSVSFESADMQDVEALVIGERVVDIAFVAEYIHQIEISFADSIV